MEELIIGEIIKLVVALIIFVPPLWVIFKKAGLSSWNSLFVLIPPFGIGILVVALLLGFKKWPKNEEL